MARHQEGEISEALVSELYSSHVLKKLENSLQFHISAMLPGLDWSLQGGKEPYSLNSLLRGADTDLVESMNLFAELESAWEKYTAAVSMFLSLKYRIIIIM